ESSGGANWLAWRNLDQESKARSALDAPMAVLSCDDVDLVIACHDRAICAVATEARSDMDLVRSGMDHLATSPGRVVPVFSDALSDRLARLRSKLIEGSRV